MNQYAVVTQCFLFSKETFLITPRNGRKFSLWEMQILLADSDSVEFFEVSE